ncbi:carbohydrate porin [Klebsiella pneumoniae]|uniref:carbohydrate porin n=1 Tax=Klebsiella pneumoniae TaxID=573 RepID=UPI003D341C7E
MTSIPCTPPRQLPNIMAMPNFNIYLGAYASWLDSTAAKSGNPDERYGARVRFKYFSDRAVWQTFAACAAGEFRRAG